MGFFARAKNKSKKTKKQKGNNRIFANLRRQCSGEKEVSLHFSVDRVVDVATLKSLSFLMVPVVCQPKVSENKGKGTKRNPTNFYEPKSKRVNHYLYKKGRISSRRRSQSASGLAGAMCSYRSAFSASLLSSDPLDRRLEEMESCHQQAELMRCWMWKSKVMLAVVPVKGSLSDARLDH